MSDEQKYSYEVTVEHAFCFGHRIEHHVDKCSRLHGHNAVIAVTVENDTLNDIGMVIDFADLKRLVAGFIDETLDHRMILAESDPLAGVLKNAGEDVVTIKHTPTAENLATFIFESLESMGLKIKHVSFWENAKNKVHVKRFSCHT